MSRQYIGSHRKRLRRRGSQLKKTCKRMYAEPSSGHHVENARELLVVPRIEGELRAVAPVARLMALARIPDLGAFLAGLGFGLRLTVPAEALRPRFAVHGIVGTIRHGHVREARDALLGHRFGQDAHVRRKSPCEPLLAVPEDAGPRIREGAIEPREQVLRLDESVVLREHHGRRASYTNRVASRGTGTVNAIVSLLYSDVEGVTFAAGYQNDNDEKDAAGRPPHCIEIIVQGGLDEDVSDIIWKNKPGGIRAYGSHYAYATDINGIRQYVEFTRVKDVYLLLSVKVTSNDELDADFETRIKSLLMAEKLLVGAPIRLQKFIRPIIENVSGIDYIEIRGILSEKQDIEDVEDGAMLTGAVPVSISQQPVVTMDGIRFVNALFQPIKSSTPIVLLNFSLNRMRKAVWATMCAIHRKI